MKVFISWSGERSKLMAQAMSETLQLILQHVKPWMSDVDIGAGTRWQAKIASELEASSFGLVCVTNENIDSAWVNFEAGALSKSLSDGQVIPILLDHPLDSLLGPLSQFQAVKPDKNGMLDIIKSINKYSAERGIEAERLNKILTGGSANDIDELVRKLGKIKKSDGSAKPQRDQNKLLEEVHERLSGIEVGLLEVMRAQNKSLERVVSHLERETSSGLSRYQRLVAVGNRDSDLRSSRLGALPDTPHPGGLRNFAIRDLDDAPAPSLSQEDTEDDEG